MGSLWPLLLPLLVWMWMVTLVSLGPEGLLMLIALVDV